MPIKREFRSRPISIAPVIALAILATGLAIAQQNLPVPPAKAPVQEPATGAAAKSPGDEAGPGNEAPPGNQSAPGSEAPSAQPAAAKGSPQRFEPTEKVRPDFDVAFPVDI
jgi:hypothetical protein